MIRTIPSANDNAARRKAPPKNPTSSTKSRAQRRISVRLLHEEAPALRGLAAALNSSDCDVQTVDREDQNAALNTRDAPDLCILGNLEDCTEQQIQSLRRAWPATAIILFDLSIHDEDDLADCANGYRRLGFDGFLPASSSTEEIKQCIQQLFRDHQNAARRDPRTVPMMLC